MIHRKLPWETLAGLWTCRAREACTRSRLFPARRSLSTSSVAPIKILALESSADDTCAAIVDSDRNIHANVVMKQDDLLAKYGGIHPYHATSRHQSNMAKAIRKCLDEANMDVSEMNAIAYTRGPGMASCLASCALAGKTLAMAYEKPLIGVHHMQAHALTVGLTEQEAPAFPYLTLLISGGHTLLLLASGPFDYEILATSEDDAIGDAFDKVARWLNIPAGTSAGGAALESYIKSRDTNQEVDLPSTTRGKLVFSFSGLKAAVKREVGKMQPEDEDRKHAIAAAFQSVAVGQLEEKVALALRKLEGVELSSLVVSGGVASNLYLRERLRACLDSHGKQSMRLLFPPVSLCTDNAVMIAWAAMERYKRQMWDGCDSPIRSKWDISDCASMQ